MPPKGDLHQATRYLQPDTYEKFTYPDPGDVTNHSKLTSLAFEVGASLKQVMGEGRALDIIEVGSGTGIPTVYLLEQMLRGPAPSRLSYTSIEANERMNDKLQVRLRGNAVLQHAVRDGALTIAGSSAPVDVAAWLRANPGRKFDVLFLFLFIHLPARGIEVAWKDPRPIGSGRPEDLYKPQGYHWPGQNLPCALEVVDGLLQRLGDDGIILMSTLGGEHALWGCEFDSAGAAADSCGVPADIGDERVLLRRALTEVQDTLFHLGISNRRALSASDLTLMERYLWFRGFKQVVDHSCEWSNRFSWDELVGTLTASPKDGSPYSALPVWTDPAEPRMMLASLLNTPGYAAGPAKLETHDRFSVRLFRRSNAR